MSVSQDTTMTHYIYLDDIRDCPHTSDDNVTWLVARNVSQFKEMVLKYKPVGFSFDHDLGGNETAMDAVKWLCEELEYDFEYEIHSANPIGVANLTSYLKSYFKSKTL